jgi:hypothetical protein
MQTLDSTFFDFHGQGSYLDCATSVDNLQIISCQQPWATGIVSVNEAVFLRYKGDRVAIYPNAARSSVVFSASSAVSSPMVERAVAVGGSYVAPSRALAVTRPLQSQFEIRLDNSALVRVQFLVLTYAQRVLMNVYFLPPPAYFNQTRGLCGQWNCRQDELVGTTAAAYGAQWFVSESVWPANYSCPSNRTFAGPGSANIPANVQAAARNCCLEARVDPSLQQFAWCVEDVANEMALRGSTECLRDGMVANPGFNPSTCSCPSDCNGRGRCVNQLDIAAALQDPRFVSRCPAGAKALCVCNEGFDGIDCSVAQCRCNPNQQCNDGICGACLDGWTGANCNVRKECDAQYWSVGDPHFQVFGGRYDTHMGIGTYSDYANAFDSLRVFSCQQPWVTGSGATVNTAAMVEFGRDRVALLRNGTQYSLFINNVRATLAVGQTLTLFSRQLKVLRSDAFTYRVDATNGATITLQAYPSFMNIFVLPSPLHFNRTSGLASVWNCRPELGLLMANGSFTQNFAAFAESWRVVDATSATLWPPGFTCPAAPAGFVPIAPADLEPVLAEVTACCAHLPATAPADVVRFCHLDALAVIRARQNCSTSPLLQNPFYTRNDTVPDGPQCLRGCSNRGRCVVQDGAAFCVCERGFAGVDCSEALCECAATEECIEGLCRPLDPCRNVSCRNGGKCARGLCFCPVTHIGDRCEVSVCDDVVCANGGTCNATLGGVCSCVAGFFGRRCEQDVDPCVGVQCLNGGRCLAGNCTCPEQFFGSRCQNRTRREAVVLRLELVLGDVAVQQIAANRTLREENERKLCDDVNQALGCNCIDRIKCTLNVSSATGGATGIRMRLQNAGGAIGAVITFLPTLNETAPLPSELAGSLQEQASIPGSPIYQTELLGSSFNADVGVQASTTELEACGDTFVPVGTCPAGNQLDPPSDEESEFSLTYIIGGAVIVAIVLLIAVLIACRCCRRTHKPLTESASAEPVRAAEPALLPPAPSVEMVTSGDTRLASGDCGMPSSSAALNADAAAGSSNLLSADAVGGSSSALH